MIINGRYLNRSVSADGLLKKDGFEYVVDYAGVLCGDPGGTFEVCPHYTGHSLLYQIFEEKVEKRRGSLGAPPSQAAPSGHRLVREVLFYGESEEKQGT